MSSQPGRRAIIIGGSVAGIAAAVLLRRDGWQVEVFERAETGLEGRGAGIATHPELFEMFAAAGIATPDELGFWVQGRRVIGRDGTCVGELELPQLMSSWDRLHKALRAGLPDEFYHRGRRLVRLDQDGEGATAHFADGASVHGDLLIGADGFRSTVREQCFPDLQPLYAGYVVWRGLVDEDLVSPQTHRDLFGHFAIGLPEREQLIGYAVAGAHDDTRAGHRRYNWGWYRHVGAEDLRDLLRDETGHEHELSIPPPLIRGAVITALRADSLQTLPPQFQELLRLTPQPFFQPIYDFETPRMTVGRVAIIGDAAFLARPHIGAGVNKATSDAWALATALREAEGDLSAGLQRFEAVRMPYGRRAVSCGRMLGAYMEARSDAERNAAMRYRDPAAIMAATANMAFLE